MLACFFGTAASVRSLVCQCELETQPSAHGGLQLLAWESGVMNQAVLSAFIAIELLAVSGTVIGPVGGP